MQGMKTQLIHLSTLLRLLDSGFCNYLGMWINSDHLLVFIDTYIDTPKSPKTPFKHTVVYAEQC